MNVSFSALEPTQDVAEALRVLGVRSVYETAWLVDDVDNFARHRLVKRGGDVNFKYALAKTVYRACLVVAACCGFDEVSREMVRRGRRVVVRYADGGGEESVLRLRDSGRLVSALDEDKRTRRGRGDVLEAAIKQTERELADLKRKRVEREKRERPYKARNNHMSMGDLVRGRYKNGSG